MGDGDAGPVEEDQAKVVLELEEAGGYVCFEKIQEKNTSRRACERSELSSSGLHVHCGERPNICEEGGEEG